MARAPCFAQWESPELGRDFAADPARLAGDPRWAESGALITGLPAMVMSAFSWPLPGVAISSAMHEHGTWPSR